MGCPCRAHPTRPQICYPRAAMGGAETPSIRLIRMSAIGPFSWGWPEQLERFHRGWIATAEVDGINVHVRHGIRRRTAYGRLRARSVTWVEGAPTVEGVGADDFEQSVSLLSLLKVTKRHLRPGDVPSTIVVMGDEAAGPYSPRSLAVKLREDDINGLTRHALIRAPRGPDCYRTRARASLPPVSAVGPAPAPPPLPSEDSCLAVVNALLKYGRGHEEDPRAPSLDFTSNPGSERAAARQPICICPRCAFRPGRAGRTRLARATPVARPTRTLRRDAHRR